jgi:hypothetical protein
MVIALLACLTATVATGLAAYGEQGNGPLAAVMVSDANAVGRDEIARSSAGPRALEQKHRMLATPSHLRQLSMRRMLIGTWEAADWAIRFYTRHGFELVAAERKTVLLKTYWNVPDRQIEVSVVLANPPVDEA